MPNSANRHTTQGSLSNSDCDPFFYAHIRPLLNNFINYFTNSINAHRGHFKGLDDAQYHFDPKMQIRGISAPFISLSGGFVR
jgi:hypothetical protein